MSSKPIDFGDYIGGEDALKTSARAVRSLKKDIADLLKSIAEDSTRINAGFSSITAAVKKLQENGGKLNLLNPEDKKLLQEYIPEAYCLKTAREYLGRSE